MAKTTTSKSAKAKKQVATVTPDGQYPIYEPGASRDAYKKGDIVFFPKVRSWLDRGAIVEAYGRIVSVELFDGEVPYLEVSFDDPSVKKLNAVDLGKDHRKFLLEVK